MGMKVAVDMGVVKICSNCLWYDPPITFGEVGWGSCSRAGKPGTLFGCTDRLLVDKSFGCIQFEKK